MLANFGVTSRRKAEELIIEGRVLLNGEVVKELGTKANPERDHIEVDGRIITGKVGPKVYVLLNKPKSVISAVTDPEQRPVVIDFLKKIRARVFPIGRLDYDAEGVILLTNDGELTNRLIHPKYKIEKKYHVKVRGIPNDKVIAKLRSGVYLDDGRTLPARVTFLRSTKENSWIEITVTEGRNRLIKRMCQRVGHPVQKLKRVEFAGIKIGKLKHGEFRRLTDREVARLKGEE